MCSSDLQDPAFLAKTIAQAHPELQRARLEDTKMFQRAAFKYAGELMRQGGESNTAVINLINGYADEDWPSDFISALGQELEHGEKEDMPGFSGTWDALSKLSVKKENLHMPPLQATGQTIVANEDAITNPGMGFGMLSPDERQQLKEYINSIKTIKEEIAKLTAKAGKKVKEDLGGDRTNLTMSTDTSKNIWEGNDGMEEVIDQKLKEAFEKITGMLVKDLMEDGFDGGDIKLYLDHIIEEKAKEAANAQHDF